MSDSTIPSRVFVTGTDTGVGKTYISTLLLSAMRQDGQDAVGFKPVACGDRLDAQALLEAGSPGVGLDEINPVWLKTPASPLAAGMIENRPVDIDGLTADFESLAERFERIVVEGAGGWEVPITEEITMAGFAAKLGLPVVVVVDNKLGALNHTILTVKSIATHGLRCAGIVLNQVAEERDSASISNRAVLERTLNVPILAEVMHGEDTLPTLAGV